MGVIGRLVRWGLRLGVVVLALTAGAVMYFSSANLQTYGEGRALAAPADAILVLGGGVDGDGVLGYSSRRRVAAAVELLRQESNVTVVDDERWVRDGNVITAAGVSAGIDMALYLVAELTNSETAKRVQHMMEYYPKPPQFAEAGEETPV